MTADRSATVLISANSAWNLVNFRAPLIAGLKEAGYEVFAAAPKSNDTTALHNIGVQVYHLPIDASGLSPLRDARLFLAYNALLKQLRPDALLTFTPKPNIYGSMAAARVGVPVLNTITGLGTGFLSGYVLERLVTVLYRLALRSSRRVYFHNRDDRDLFVERRLVRLEQTAVICGSGIDLHKFAPDPRQVGDGPTTFLFVGRFLKDKGVVEFLRAAELVKAQDASVRFQMLGSIEDHPKAAPPGLLRRMAMSGTIEFLEATDDVRPFIASADCLVLPSYREGLPRVVLEASAMAIPAIVTDVPGCRDAVEDGVTGLICEPRSAQALASAMVAFTQMPRARRLAMGQRARSKAEGEFSQERVIREYLDALRMLGI